MTSTIESQDITISLDMTQGAPIYRQIIQQVEYAVLSGRAREGDRLPTIRQLSVELKINPNTIAKAYGELEIRGIVETRAGCGTYIAGGAPISGDGDRERKIMEILGRFLKEMSDLGVEKTEIVELITSYGGET